MRDNTEIPMEIHAFKQLLNPSKRRFSRRYTHTLLLSSLSLLSLSFTPSTSTIALLLSSSYLSSHAAISFPSPILDLWQLTEESCPPPPIKGTRSPLRDGAAWVLAVPPSIALSICWYRSEEFLGDKLTCVLSPKLYSDKLTNTGRYWKGFVDCAYHYFICNCGRLKHWTSLWNDTEPKNLSQQSTWYCH